MPRHSRGKIIAIDGPAASGKSTTARLVAKKLGFLWLDTGAMYRAVTLFALEQSVPGDNEPALAALARRLRFEFRAQHNGSRLWVNGRDVSQGIRSLFVTRAVSQVSKHPQVRRVLVKQQQVCGRRGNIVVEGRDTTTVVFPRADLKIYLDASLKERARRRLAELREAGVKSTLAEQMKAITLRDRSDSRRQASPLRRAPDAVYLDTTKLTVRQQVTAIVRLFRQKFPGGTKRKI